MQITALLRAEPAQEGTQGESRASESGAEATQTQ